MYSYVTAGKFALQVWTASKQQRHAAAVRRLACKQFEHGSVKLASVGDDHAVRVLDVSKLLTKQEMQLA